MQAQGGTNVFKKSLATNMLTSLWKKCSTKQQNTSGLLDESEKCELSSSPQSEQFSKIVMCKQEFLSFTKKFAISKIDYEQKIQQLTEQVTDKASRIQALTEQVGDLRTQEDYLMRVMEQLRDRHIQQVAALNNRNQNNNKVKQAQIQYLKNQIIKVRTWLDQEKLQAKRCMQFLKIKDEIIQNLEWEVVKCRNEIKCLKELQKSHSSEGIVNYLSSTLSTMKISQNVESIMPITARKRTNSNKKIIIRKQKKETVVQDNNIDKQNKKKLIVKQKHQLNNSGSCSTLKIKIGQLQAEKTNIENQKCELYQKLQQLMMQNQMLRRSQQILEKQHKESSKIKKSISELDQITRRIKDTQIDKDSMWAIKCTFLERQVQQLQQQLLVQNQNKKGKNSCVLQFSKDFTPADPQMYNHESDLIEDQSEQI